MTCYRVLFRFFGLSFGNTVRNNGMERDTELRVLKSERRLGIVIRVRMMENIYLGRSNDQTVKGWLKKTQTLLI